MSDDDLDTDVADQQAELTRVQQQLRQARQQLAAEQQARQQLLLQNPQSLYPHLQMGWGSGPQNPLWYGNHPPYWINPFNHPPPSAGAAMHLAGQEDFFAPRNPASGASSAFSFSAAHPLQQQHVNVAGPDAGGAASATSVFAHGSSLSMGSGFSAGGGRPRRPSQAWNPTYAPFADMRSSSAPNMASQSDDVMIPVDTGLSFRARGLSETAQTAAPDMFPYFLPSRPPNDNETTPRTHHQHRSARRQSHLRSRRSHRLTNRRRHVKTARKSERITGTRETATKTTHGSSQRASASQPAPVRIKPAHDSIIYVSRKARRGPVDSGGPESSDEDEKDDEKEMDADIVMSEMENGYEGSDRNLYFKTKYPLPKTLDPTNVPHDVLRLFGDNARYIDVIPRKRIVGLRTLECIPPGLDVYYFEILYSDTKHEREENDDDDIGVSIGFVSNKWRPDEPFSHGKPGLRRSRDENSYGFELGAYLPPNTDDKVADGDVIGMGIDFESKQFFFTKNGQLIGDSGKYQNCHPIVDCDQLFPAVSFQRAHDDVSFNFGFSQFEFDLNTYRERMTRQTELCYQDNAARLGIETNLAAACMIRQHLIFTACPETLEKLVAEVGFEDMDDLRDDPGFQSMRARYQIKENIMKGNIDLARDLVCEFLTRNPFEEFIEATRRNGMEIGRIALNKRMRIYFLLDLCQIIDTLRVPNNRNAAYHLVVEKISQMCQQLDESTLISSNIRKALSKLIQVICMTQNDEDEVISHAVPELFDPALRRDFTQQINKDLFYFAMLLNQHEQSERKEGKRKEAGVALKDRINKSKSYHRERRNKHIRSLLETIPSHDGKEKNFEDEESFFDPDSSIRKYLKHSMCIRELWRKTNHCRAAPSSVFSTDALRPKRSCEQEEIAAESSHHEIQQQQIDDDEDMIDID